MTICLAFPTVMDGLVLRWYRDETAAQIGDEILSASRNGVLVKGHLHTVPAEALAKANEAFEILRDNGPRQLAAQMATHRRKSVMSREIVPIERDAAPGGA